MSSLPLAQSIVPKGEFTAAGTVSLGYDARILRRKRLISEANEPFMVNLAEVTSFAGGEGFLLDDGRVIEVIPAPEEVLVIRGDLARLAWHIGNRHTPCQIEADRLIIRPDHVLQAMLAQLGAQLTFETAPFTPEGGAYGVGRTMGHSHGREAPEPALDHAHAHTHEHPHDHAHEQGHDHTHHDHHGHHTHAHHGPHSHSHD